MKKWLILFWLMCPVVFLYCHFQFGPKFQFEAQMDRDIAAAKSQETSDDWPAAVEIYNSMLGKVSDFRQAQDEKASVSLKDAKNKELLQANLTSVDRLEIRIKLARAKALTNTASLASATTILEDLLFELEEKNIDDDLVDEVRNNLAICQYYIAWHMRLEGLLREDWMPELESSRQHLKYLALKSQNNHQDNQNQQAEDCMKNLEAVIRLERMDLPTLRKLKLPDQGAGKGEPKAGQKRKKDKKNSKKQQKKKKKSKKKGNKPSENSREGGFNDYPLPPGS